jgi:enoyl-CoA hydratase/carnithine racemase
MGYNTIQYDVEGEIGILTYNRPKSINAMNNEMVNELVDFWWHRQDDSSVKVIVTKGAGEKGFCSGLDLKEVMEKQQEPASDSGYQYQSFFSRIYRLMRSCPQPIVTALHGPAFGGGFSLALASDIRIAAENAVFCAQFINVGIGGADMGSSYFLWRLVGWGKAAEMLLTGNKIDAAEALRIGLVNDVCPTEKLIPTAMDMARGMAQKSKIALHWTKDALNSALNGISLEDAMKIEDRNQVYIGGVAARVNTRIQKQGEKK